MPQLIVPISDHPVLNKKRAIRLKGLQYVEFDLLEATVVWEEVYLDEKDEPIFDKTVARRSITSHISNNTLVYVATDPKDPIPTGIVIDSTNFPQLEGESDEDYQLRFEQIKQKGQPEFEFYVSNILNLQAIGGAILLLDHLKRFDRE